MAWPRFLRKLLGREAPVAEVDPEIRPTVDVVPAPAEVLADDADVDEDDFDDDDDDDDEPVSSRERDPDLEARLRAARHDRDLHLVYADWLQQRGDPRGELVVIEVELESQALDAAKRQALRERERELLTAHHDELVGPLDEEHTVFRFGFMRHLHAGELPAAPVLVRALDHVAYLLLDSICVAAADDVTAVRDALQELGRDDVVVRTEDDYLPAPALVPAVVATVNVKTIDGQRWIDGWVDNSFGMDGGSHSFLVRSRVDSGTWSYGCDGSLCEDGLADDPVRTEEFPCAATDRELVLELRFGIENTGTVAMYFRGTAPLPVEDGSFEMTLVRCDALSGVPFEPSPVVERAAVVGADIATGPAHIAMRGSTPPGFAPPSATRGLVVGGMDGTLAATYSPAWSATADRSIKALLAMVAPDGSAVHVPLHDFVMVLLPLAGHAVAVATTKSLAVYDARTGARRWDHALEPHDGRFDSNGNLTLVEDAGALHLLRNGRVTRYAIDSGEHAPGPIVRMLLATMKNYGVGAPAFHPVPARVAWMHCASSSHCGFSPRSVIGWRDRDGGGEVAIAEDGWARDGDAFGKVAVLPDGRIVAIGTSVWLVEPPSTTAIRLGDAGAYNQPLQLTRHGDAWRLWNPGDGPAYLEFR